MSNKTFISTKGINPGDEFILKGILNLIKYDENTEIKVLNKHKPFIETKVLDNKGEYFLNWRITKYFILFVNLIFKSIKKNSLKNTTIIHAGQPFFYKFKSFIFNITTFNSMWFLNFYKFNFINKNSKLLLLALGTTVYNNQQFDSILNDKKFIKKVKSLGNKSNLITTRDLKTKLIFDKAGVDSQYLPCTAFFSANQESLNDNNEYILLNFMKNGSNNYKELNINQEIWQKKIKAIVQKLELLNVPIRFVSHTTEDFYFQNKNFPNYENFFSENSEDFYPIYQNSIGGIFNRIHGAFLSLSNLKPTICINQDSRIEMFEILETKTYMTKDISEVEVVEEFTKLVRNYDSNKKKLASLKKEYSEKYLSIIKEFI